MRVLETKKKKARPSTRIPEFLNDGRALKFIKEYYKREGKENYPEIAISRWKKETHYPPVEVLIGIANILDTNLSYLLGLTDVNCKCDYSKEPVYHTLADLMSVRGISKRELAIALDKSYKVLHNFEEELPRKRVYSLIRLSQAIDLSVDYILGYTSWETWEMQEQLGRPFANIRPGTGAYVVADKDVRTINDVEEAIRRGDGQYCLLSPDGEYVLFPNGKAFSVNDEMFRGIYVARVVPEVK